MQPTTMRGLAVTGALAATLATGPAAEAMTLEAGRPTLSARIAITVPLTVSCPPFDPSLVMNTASVRVTVEQAAGRQIAHGKGEASTASPLLFACDDTERTVQVAVLADPAAVPFKRGQAVMTASAWAGAATPCPWSPNCYTSPWTSQYAAVGPVAVRIR